MHESTIHKRKVKKLWLKKKKKSEMQTCVWETQNALPKCTAFGWVYLGLKFVQFEDQIVL